jgi:O-antigen/teichoic acid export membrane protein
MEIRNDFSFHFSLPSQSQRKCIFAPEKLSPRLNSLVKKLAQQTAIYGVSSILARFLNYALVPIQTRVFHPEQYGVVTQFFAYAGFLNILFTYGMETTFFRFATSRDDKKQVYDTGLLSMILTSLLFSALLILFKQPIAAFMQFNGHTEYVTVLALTLALDAVITIPFAYLRQENRPIRFATFKIVNISVNVGLNIFFLIICPWMLTNPSLAIFHSAIRSIYHPEWGVMYIFIAGLIASIITVLAMSRYFVITRWRVSLDLWKEMLAYSWPLIIIGLAGMGNELLSRILLTRRWSGPYSEAIHALGVFGACYKMSLLMTLFVQAYRMAAEPFFFGESKKQNPQLTYARTMSFFVIFCCFIFLLVTLFIDFFKEIFMGAEYFDGVRVVPILLLANFFLGVYYNLTIWYKLTNKNFAGSIIAIAGLVITLALNWIWIPLYGYYGSAWVTFICYGFMMVISYFLGRKFYPVPYDVTRFFVYIGLAVGIFFLDQEISMLIPSAYYYATYGIGILFLCLYTGIVYVFETGKLPVFKPIV